VNFPANPRVRTKSRVVSIKTWPTKGESNKEHAITSCVASTLINRPAEYFSFSQYSTAMIWNETAKIVNRSQLVQIDRLHPRQLITLSRRD